MGIQLLGVGLVSGVSRDSDPEEAGMDSDYAHDRFGRGDELSSDGDVESNPGPATTHPVGWCNKGPNDSYTASGHELEQLIRTVSRLKRVLHVRIALERAYGHVTHNCFSRCTSRLMPMRRCLNVRSPACLQLGRASVMIL